jgi:hypothetical protein
MRAAPARRRSGVRGCCSPALWRSGGARLLLADPLALGWHAAPARRPLAFGGARLLLLDLLDDPGAVGLAREDHPCRAMGAGGHQVRAILLDSRPVVDENEVQRFPLR